MSEVPAPSKVTADATAVRGLADKVAETYRALHDSGFRFDAAGDRVGGGRRRVAEDGSENGATPAVVEARDRLRADLAAVAQGMELASTLLSGALVKLRKAAVVVERGADHSADEGVIPRTVMKVEVAEARAHQARRDAEQSLRVLKRARADAGRERAKGRPKAPRRGRAA